MYVLLATQVTRVPDDKYAGQEPARQHPCTLSRQHPAYAYFMSTCALCALLSRALDRALQLFAIAGRLAARAFASDSYCQ